MLSFDEQADGGRADRSSVFGVINWQRLSDPATPMK